MPKLPPLVLDEGIEVRHALTTASERLSRVASELMIDGEAKDQRSSSSGQRGSLAFIEAPRGKARQISSECSDFLSTLSHVHDVEAGPGSQRTEFDYLSALEVSEHFASHVEFKLRRDQLRAAVEGQLENASVYTLNWASEIIQSHAGMPPRQIFNHRLTFRITVLAAFIQIFVPIALITVEQSHMRLPFLFCPTLHTPHPHHPNPPYAFKRTVYGVCVYVLSWLTCLTNYGAIQYEEAAYRFLAQFAPPSSSRRGAAKHAVPVSEPRDDPECGEYGLCMLISAGVQMLSFKLVLATLIFLFFTQSDLMDIVLNCLALQFILDVDSTIITPIRNRDLVEREMKKWFEDFDWYGDEVKAYLEHDAQRPTVTFPGVGDMPCVRVLPFVVVDPKARFCVRVEHEWFRRHWTIKILSATDGLMIPLVLYFVLAMPFCAEYSWPESDD